MAPKKPRVSSDMEKATQEMLHPRKKTPYEIRKIAEEGIDRAESVIGQLRKQKSQALSEAQTFGAYKTRRVEALLENMQAIRERFAEKHPETRIEDDFIHINTVTLFNYEQVEEKTRFSTAAAIWMLDQLRRTDKLAEAYQIIGDDADSEETDEAEIAECYDAVHPLDTIRAMVSIIQHRHDSLQGKYHCLIVDEGTARKRRVRSKFTQIAELIDDELKQEACRHYEESMWRYMSLFFDANSVHSREEHRFILRMEEERKKLPSMEQAMDPMRMTPWSTSSFLTPLNNMDILNPSVAAERIMELDNKRTEMFLALDHSVDYGQDFLTDHIGAEMARPFNEFTVDDPFGISFALFYLLDEGSSLPFLYFPGVLMMDAVGRCLPWRNKMLELWNTGDTEDKNLTIPEKGLPEDWITKAQKIYDATGCLLPRNGGLFEWADKMVGKKLSPAAAVLLEVGGQRRRQFDFYYNTSTNKRRNEQEDKKNEQEEEHPEVTGRQSDSATMEKLKRCQAENERLRRQLHDALQQAHELQNQQDRLRSEKEYERQELIGLRDLIYQLENSEEELPLPKEETVTWPYQLQKRTVVFGGHESWLKGMRDKIHGAYWVDKDAVVNPDIIRNSDMVWFQVNCMSHKQYNNAVDVCRREKLTPRYFSNSSHIISAMQMVEEDHKL